MWTPKPLILIILCVCSDAVYGYETWINTYDCDGFCYDLYVLPPFEGNSTFACYCYSTDFTTWLVQVDESGDTVWQHTFDKPPRGLTALPDGGCVLLTCWYSESQLVRLDSAGNTEWSLDLPVSARDLYTTSDGFLVLRFGTQLQKRDLDGDIVWTISPPPQMEYPTGFGDAPSQPGGFTIAGVDDGWFQLGISDPAGSVPWTGEFHDPYYGYDSTEAVFSDEDGNCYGCVTYSIPYPPPDAVSWVLRVNTGGEVEWSVEYDDAGGICPSPEGKVVVTGNYEDAEFFIRFLHKLTGAITGQVLQGIPGIAMFPHDLVPCSQGGYLIGGSAGPDVFLARTDSLGLIDGTGISQPDPAVPVVTVSPNPASTSVTVNVSSQTDGPVSVKVYDVSGRNVATLAEGQTQSDELVWDLTGPGGRSISSGCYFIICTSQGSTAAEKVMILR